MHKRQIRQSALQDRVDKSHDQLNRSVSDAQTLHTDSVTDALYKFNMSSDEHRRQAQRIINDESTEESECEEESEGEEADVKESRDQGSSPGPGQLKKATQRTFLYILICLRRFH
jgi:hypothetical protein